jgi:hypothetical protein
MWQKSFKILKKKEKKKEVYIFQKKFIAKKYSLFIFIFSFWRDFVPHIEQCHNQGS